MPEALESPRAEKIETELSRCLLLNLGRVRAGTCEISRSRLDACLRRIYRVESIFELEPEILDEIARVDDAKTRAQSDEPLIANLLS